MYTIRKKWASSLLLRKMIWTLLIVLVYMIGRFLPVPTAVVSQEVANHHLLNNLATVTGARISAMTLFSLGLSPWMTTIIIWRFFTVFNLFKQQTQAQIYRYRMLLTLVVGAIQGLGLTATADLRELTLLGLSGDGPAIWVTILILIAGSVVLTWLGNRNAERGLGGMTILILVNMILAFLENGLSFFAEVQRFSWSLLGQVLVFLLVYGALVLMTVTLYRGEYRIPIKRVGLNSSYNQKSYLPPNYS